MAENSFEIDFTEVDKYLDEVNQKLNSVALRDKKFLDIISIFIFKDVIDHFKKEEGPDGNWKEWSVSYKKFLNKIGRGSNKKLQFSGHLRQTFKQNNYKTDGELIYWYNNAKTSRGFPYAFAHNEGGPKLPKREFMFLSKNAEQSILRMMLNYVSGEKV